MFIYLSTAHFFIVNCAFQKSESAYAEKYAEVRAESAFLKSQVKKLQIQQEMANMEVRDYVSEVGSWWWDEYWQIG